MPHLVNKQGIPKVCPKCGIENPPVSVKDYDMMWGDGKVVCGNCGEFFRHYDSG